jgi:hypothetical protein
VIHVQTDSHTRRLTDRAHGYVRRTTVHVRVFISTILLITRCPSKPNSAPQEFSACLAVVASRLVSSRPLPCPSGLACGSVQHRLPAPASDPLLSATTRSRDVWLYVYPVFSDVCFLADRVPAARRCRWRGFICVGKCRLRVRPFKRLAPSTQKTLRPSTPSDRYACFFTLPHTCHTLPLHPRCTGIRWRRWHGWSPAKKSPSHLPLQILDRPVSRYWSPVHVSSRRLALVLQVQGLSSNARSQFDSHLRDRWASSMRQKQSAISMIGKCYGCLFFVQPGPGSDMPTIPCPNEVALRLVRSRPS